MLPASSLIASQDSGLVATGAPAEPAAEPGGPVIVAHDATYGARGYRSFEFASFVGREGEVVALLSSDRAPARDLALACAGFVRPTAGSLSVGGIELARPSGARHRISRGPRLPRGYAGVGVFSGLFDIDRELTVEEAVVRELRLRAERTRCIAEPPLEYLAMHHLATHADQRVSQLAPLYRARVSAALACAGGVKVAAIDLGDAFVEGLSADDACAVVDGVRSVAGDRGVCVVVATQELRAALSADSRCALDIASKEGLERTASLHEGAQAKKEGDAR